MTEIADPAVASFPRSKFERFLLASIGEDSNDNGMQLSVLSALARQNVGGVEALELVRDRLGLGGSLIGHAAEWNSHPEAIGFGVKAASFSPAGWFRRGLIRWGPRRAQRA